MIAIRDQIIVIPSYEPDHLMVELVEKLSERFAHILVVDDGSGDVGAAHFERVKVFPQVIFLQHEENLGKGGALKTAFRYVKKEFPRAQSVVLCGADGQHLPEDILHVAAVSSQNPEQFIFGIRSFDRKDTPFRSFFGNVLTRTILKLVLNISLQDTQTGLRAYPVKHLDAFVDIPYDRYEYDTESIILISKNRWKICTVPIKTVYIDGNRRSHFNPIVDSLKISWVIFKFCLVSLFSFLLDVAIFSALTWADFSTFFSLLVSRFVSAIFNFLCHRRLTFNSRNSLTKSLSYYAILWLVNLFLGTYLIDKIVSLTHWAKVPTKIGVDVLLFCFNFLISHIFIFPSTSTRKSDKR